MKYSCSLASADTTFGPTVVTQGTRDEMLEKREIVCVWGLSPLPAMGKEANADYLGEISRFDPNPTRQ